MVLMTIPELYFKNADGIIEWHKTEIPESYEAYLRLVKRVGDSKFPGAIRLLRNLKNSRQVPIFLSFLTEVNVANLLLEKLVVNLSYESVVGIDFSFENIAMSVKNLHPKIYQKTEELKIEELRASGGGKVIITHKNFSEISIDVQKTELGTFGWERLETGHSGFLDSDLSEMSSPLAHMGEFENIEITNKKRVLFFFIHSSEFRPHHIQNIIIWYFGYRVEKYSPIFENDSNWYWRLFKNKTKKKNIDALMFMYSPRTSLAWPDGCLKEVINKVPRLMVFAPDRELKKRLITIFS